MWNLEFACMNSTNLPLEQLVPDGFDKTDGFLPFEEATSLQRGND